MRTLQILVCAQSNDSRVRKEYPYTPIQTGASLHPEKDLGFIMDNTGDNISEKNTNFCEWCAHYWAWKNIKDVKYIGLCHYRRYFDMDISDSKVESILKNKDAIVIRQDSRMVSRRQRTDDLIRMTSMEDTYLFFDTFISLYPQYEKKLIQYFFNSRDSVPYSMIITTKDKYDRICEFVFPILFELEKNRREHGYSRENRAIAYVGEYILGLAIFCLGLSTYRAPLIFLSDKPEHTNKIIRSVKCHIKYAISRIGCMICDSVSPIPDEIKCPPAVRIGLMNDGVVIKNLK